MAVHRVAVDSEVVSDRVLQASPDSVFRILESFRLEYTSVEAYP